MELNQITEKIIGAAMKVHSALGPGLLESAYEACLAYELGRLGFKIERQKKQPVIYEDLKIDEGYRLDLVVEGCAIVELKALAAIAEVHKAQVLSYLRLSGYEIGLLINFHVPHLRDGIHRIINTKK